MTTAAPADSAFVLWGGAHLAAIVLTITTPVVLSVLARRCSAGVTKAICLGFAAMLVGNAVVHWVYQVATVGVVEFIMQHMPLHICGITVFVLAWALVLRSQRAYEVAFFWGLAGTANALLTPQLEVGFPAYRFFHFFIGHGGIVAGVLFLTWGLRMRPTFASLLRAYGWLAVLFAVLLVVNSLLGSNYMFLRAPPRSASPFFFAPWPYYIPVLAAVGFVFFCVLLAPFKVADWVRTRSPANGP